MASRAAINFAKMYGVDLARKMGFLVQDHHLLTAADGAGESELEAFALIVGQNAAYFNKGMMSQMQSNPLDTANDCYYATAKTNVELITMSDFSQYAGVDGYDVNVFGDLAMVMLIALVDELDSCSFNEFLISMDGMLSNIPAGVAAAINLATQFGTGFTD